MLKLSTFIPYTTSCHLAISGSKFIKHVLNCNGLLTETDLFFENIIGNDKADK